MNPELKNLNQNRERLGTWGMFGLFAFTEELSRNACCLHDSMNDGDWFLPGGIRMFALNWNYQCGKSQQRWPCFLSSPPASCKEKKQNPNLQNILTFIHRSSWDVQHSLTSTVCVPEKCLGGCRITNLKRINLSFTMIVFRS